MRVAGLLLAAGAGRRLGMPKALVSWGGTPLVARGARLLAAAGCSPVMVTVGAAADEVIAVLSTATAADDLRPTAADDLRPASADDLGPASADSPRPVLADSQRLGEASPTTHGIRPAPIWPVRVDDWDEGMGASLRAGLAALAADRSDPVDAVVVALVDQPHVEPSLIRRLIAAATQPTAESRTAEPRIAEAATAEPGTTAESGTSAPRTAEAATVEPRTVEAVTAEPGRAVPLMAEPGTVEPQAGESDEGRPTRESADHRYIGYSDGELSGPAAPAAVVAGFGGQPRNPVLLRREIWPEVAKLAHGDVGARAWLRANRDRVLLVPCDDLGSPDDLDTPADLARLTGSPTGSRPA